MKHLIPPAFAVIFSTGGSVYGCHLAGMPPRDVMIAGLLAFSVSLAAASVAVVMQTDRLSRPRFPRSH